MSEETTEQRDPMAEYQQQLEENEFLKREGFNAWADIIFDMFGDKFPNDRRPLIKEALARFLGIGTPKFPDSFPYVPQGPYATIGPVDAEFIEPPPSVFEEMDEKGIVTVYDWQSMAIGATHAVHHPTGMVVLFDYDVMLMTLEGPSAESFWNWQQTMRGPSSRGPRIVRTRKRMRRRPRSPK